jgi:hypothetical protein
MLRAHLRVRDLPVKDTPLLFQRNSEWIHAYYYKKEKHEELKIARALYYEPKVIIMTT